MPATSSTASTSTLLDARRRQGALRPDAARGRPRDGRRHHLAARRRALLHDHHHGQCRPGDAASGILPPGAVAGARRAAGLGHRSSGRSFRSPARARATCCARSSTSKTISPTRPFPTWPRARSRDAAASRRGCSASPSRASWPTRSPCRRAMATPRSAPSWRRASEFGIAPYGTEALGVMRIEKGHVAGNELNGQTPPRSRAWPDDVDEEGLHRPRHGAAPGAARAGPAGARRLQAGRPHERACAPARISCRDGARGERRATTRAT